MQNDGEHLMEVDDSINPYELLGLDHAKCTVNDVRKAYRDLVFLCHPDRGGCPHDMRTLQVAYKWITKQLEDVSDKTQETYEEKEKNFEAFLASQQDIPVANMNEALLESIGYNDSMFDELYEETRIDHCGIRKVYAKEWVKRMLCHKSEVGFYNNDLQDIRSIIAQELDVYSKKFANQDMFHASINHGYGSLMESSAPDDDETKPVSHHFGKQEMIVYSEPSSRISVNPAHADISQPQQLEDYSWEYMTDYRVAYQDPLPETDNNLPTAPQPEEDATRLEELITYRKTHDTYVGPPKNVKAVFNNLHAKLHGIKL